jgi:hypothetical protein
MSYNELVQEVARLTEENTRLKKHCTAVPAPKSLVSPTQINPTDFSVWGIVCDE